MDRQVDQVKAKIDIVALIAEYVQLKKSGRNYKAVCPFHNEKTPSFMVNPDRQIFKCFGCGEGGDAFSFLKKMEGLEFGEALRMLAERAGVRLKDYQPSPAEKKKEALLEITNLASNLFHYLLAKHDLGKNALEYLKSRSVSKKSLDSFQLGYSPGQKNFLFKFLVKKGYLPQDIITTGLSIPTSDGPVDRFRGRIIFPIFDFSGRAIGFSGRILGSGEPKYLNSPESPIFNKSKALYGINLAKGWIKKEKSAVLVEGNLDVVSSHQVGVENVVAPLGTALTVQQLENLKRLTEDIIFAFDSDIAGDSAAKRGIEIAESLGMNMKVVEMGEDKDPDDLIRKSPLEWKKAIEKSVPVYDFFIDSAIEKYGSSSTEGKKMIVEELNPILGKIDNEVTLNESIKKLSYKAAIEETDLREEIRKYKERDNKSTGVVEKVLDRPLTPKTGNIVEKYLLALIIQSGQMVPSVTKEVFSESSYREIFEKAAKYKNSGNSWKVKQFAEELPEVLLEYFDEILLFEISNEILDYPERIEKEIDYCTARLRQLTLKKKLREISLSIKQAEAVGNGDKIRTLSRQFRDMSANLNNLEV